MATQQSEGALLNEKPLQPSLPVGKEGPNGALEANGHTMPSPINSQPESDNAPKSNGETPADTSLAKNEDAFAANQAIPRDTNDEDRSAKSKGESEQDIASSMDKVNMDDATATTRDTEMPDASTEQASGDKTEPLSPKSHPQPEPETQPDGSIKDEKDATDDVAKEAPAVPAAPVDKEDTTMTGTDKQTEATAIEAVPEDARDTAVTTDTPKSLANGAPTPAADTTNGHADPSTSTTADANMSDAAQPPAKVSRERDEIDSEDEPVAKRTKVDHAADQVQVKTGPVEDRMQVDQPAATSNAEPKKLSDDSLNDSPITDWQNKQIRAVLAGVKKTKVGAPFRLPVEQIWPMVWPEYSAKITNPIDISTMEKKLRGDLPAYANMGGFKDDLELMVRNAITFNGEGHDVTKQATACRDAILGRMSQQYAAEPPKPERKEAAKAHTTRHVEPRAAVPPISTASAGRHSKGPAASPSQKAVVESPAFALPPGNNGMPLIRRDSTKPDGRAKRPVKPAHSKDLVYDTKRKKKLPLDLRFCDELLTELRKTKHYDINAAFMQPVDPVALNIPHYHKIIKKPMDLQTMSNKLGSGEYQSSKEFEKDFDLIIKNCKTFNGEDHVVYSQALRLQDLYRAELSKRDEWMAKHAPVTTAAVSHSAGRDDSDSEDADSEPDADDDERKLVENRLATIQKRLQAEQNKVNEMVNSGTADITDVEIAQSVVAMLQKQLMGERAKLANLPPKKAGKPKAPKAKKASGALPHKKAGGGGLGGGVVKKSGVKKAIPKRKMGPLEKEIIIESLASLDGPLLERAIELIKKDTGQGENDAGELELDIETISEDALVRLYDIAIKANPNARIEKERQRGVATPAQAETPTAKSKQPAKSKKNKPMSKSEQERRIQQLNELRAQAGRQGSGSQEPMESIEGNGNEPAGQPEHESEDEVDSEED
ncbi:hypothetical protein CHGG_10620 [Chaetomium globosum CBS 148.51]|uniref:Bromo domain-containing protein n=1 Tax=Chaetomium globosum (strain ATCC 6205 / CBS 148.51 / DSM 1962 / NBRC 6347 / NRRL 1970) TaxID=306901 RepID=Q2GN34_CHAGB|nr:uncharacterized protein CHGG_10620 [Chaetomium globosum CBS 148.51]EAQ84216.1 hypothetical protein CHGG_10620 [Chaetomium globosum CBS 148.51]